MSRLLLMRRRGGEGGTSSSSNNGHDDDVGIEVRSLLPTTTTFIDNEALKPDGMNRLLFKTFWFFKTLDDGCWMKFVLLVAISGLSMSALVIYLFRSSVCIIAGNASFGLAIAVIKAELRLENMEEFYEVHNRIRYDVNRLAKTNNELTLSVSKLNNHVSSLQRTENALHIQAMQQDASVETLCSLVKRNKIILHEKEQVIRENLIAKLMNCVLQGESETDEGETFDQKEIRRMILYMQSFKPLIQINEDLLRKAIRKNNSTLSIIRLINDLGREGIQQGDRIFKFEYDGHEEELLNRII